jgi:hypothetical protein
MGVGVRPPKEAEMSASGKALSSAFDHVGRMSPGRGMVAALVISVVVALCAGCGSADSHTTATRAPTETAPLPTGTSSPPDSNTAVTHIASDADYRWSPAEALPTEDADAIATFLAG